MGKVLEAAQAGYVIDKDTGDGYKRQSGGPHCSYDPKFDFENILQAQEARHTKVILDIGHAATMNLEVYNSQHRTHIVTEVVNNGARLKRSARFNSDGILEELSVDKLLNGKAAQHIVFKRATIDRDGRKVSVLVKDKKSSRNDLLNSYRWKQAFGIKDLPARQPTKRVNIAS